MKYAALALLLLLASPVMAEDSSGITSYRA